MEKVQYYSMKGKKQRKTELCAVITLLVAIALLGLASFPLIVKIFLYDQKMDAFREYIETDIKDAEALGKKIKQDFSVTECPNIVSRADWKAKPPKDREDMKTPVPFVIIHHTYMDECFNFEDCCAEMRKIQEFHQDVRGWWDIGYSYLVGEDGLVYEGRNWTTVGAHAPWYNFKSIGISIMGDFTNKLPNNAAIKAVQTLIECAWMVDDVLEPGYIMYGHRQARNGTECPGDALFKLIQTWPHWKRGNHFPPTQQ